jgi:hypothetical protein
LFFIYHSLITEFLKAFLCVLVSTEGMEDQGYMAMQGADDGATETLPSEAATAVTDGTAMNDNAHAGPQLDGNITSINTADGGVEPQNQMEEPTGLSFIPEY